MVHPQRKCSPDAFVVYIFHNVMILECWILFLAHLPTLCINKMKAMYSLKATRTTEQPGQAFPAPGSSSLVKLFDFPLKEMSASFLLSSPSLCSRPSGLDSNGSDLSHSAPCFPHGAVASSAGTSWGSLSPVAAVVVVTMNCGGLPCFSLVAAVELGLLPGPGAWVLLVASSVVLPLLPQVQDVFL